MAQAARKVTAKDANFLAFVKLAAIRVWLRVYESAPWSLRFRQLIRASGRMSAGPCAAGIAPALRPGSP